MQVHLWDVTTASVVAAFGAVDFAAKQRELFRPVSVPSWFTCETSSGGPASSVCTAIQALMRARVSASKSMIFNV